MSSWKKAAKAGQRTHRERHQPKSREHLGLLEKKKDYSIRAKDCHEKGAAVKLLRKRALNKNPDEFYFHMINSKIQKGIHREKQKNEEHTPEQIKLMETQDLKYILFKRNIESKKVEKMQSVLHALDAANETKNKHTFFVDEDGSAKDFNVAKKLDTHPALLNRRTNRPKLSKLKHMKLLSVDESILPKIEQQKHMAYSELNKRIVRERELTIIQQKLEMDKALKDTKVPKPKTIISATKDGPPIYKWKYQRKK
ncbi:probable U3 small nucleolar RNA-associated protein 11 [Orussus abietinus]|uniref:probable U3 small nucleolar RNA-associated protein 11 n=1 Tax=Orussus abietinus TaxID=222816 RepID=UPI0006254C46|nr:probable U3 small nucleolar RNA-associated protein 11 [Orussus abietinus]